jgi:hypothetical protein
MFSMKERLSLCDLHIKQQTSRTKMILQRNKQVQDLEGGSNHTSDIQSHSSNEQVWKTLTSSKPINTIEK